MAYPVVPPNVKPIPTTSKPTNKGPNPPVTPLPVALIPWIPNNKIKVPMASDKKLEGVWRTAGPVEKVANLLPAFSSIL